MVIPGRKYSAGSGYRYGFNGKENDNDVKGEGNQQDYGFRIYDPRIGKFLSADPLHSKYPSWTPYAFAMNDVIRCIDLDGAEKKVVIHWIDGFYEDGKPKIKQTRVDINQSITYHNVYLATGLPTNDGKKYAATEVYYALPDGRFVQAETMYEEIGNGKPKPSAGYNYLDPATSWNKQLDDASYITEGPKGYFPAFAEILSRDANAPDHAMAMEDFTGVEAAFIVIAHVNLKGGMGSWIEENQAGRSAFTKNYQKQITEKENQDFLYNGVRYDGTKNGVLLDAKGKYAFLLKKGWAQEGLLKQAQRQIKAANGTKIEWHFAEQEAASTVQQLFKDKGITGIDVHYTPSVGKTP